MMQRIGPRAAKSAQRFGVPPESTDLGNPSQKGAFISNPKTVGKQGGTYDFSGVKPMVGFGGVSGGGYIENPNDPGHGWGYNPGLAPKGGTPPGFTGPNNQGPNGAPGPFPTYQTPGQFGPAAPPGSNNEPVNAVASEAGLPHATEAQRQNFYQRTYGGLGLQAMAPWDIQRHNDKISAMYQKQGKQVPADKLLDATYGGMVDPMVANMRNLTPAQKNSAEYKTAMRNFDNYGRRLGGLPVGPPLPNGVQPNNPADMAAATRIQGLRAQGAGRSPTPGAGAATAATQSGAGVSPGAASAFSNALNGNPQLMAQFKQALQSSQNLQIKNALAAAQGGVGGQYNRPTGFGGPSAPSGPGGWASAGGRAGLRGAMSTAQGPGMAYAGGSSTFDESGGGGAAAIPPGGGMMYPGGSATFNEGAGMGTSAPNPGFTGPSLAQAPGGAQGYGNWQGRNTPKQSYLSQFTGKGGAGYDQAMANSGNSWNGQDVWRGAGPPPDNSWPWQPATPTGKNVGNDMGVSGFGGTKSAAQLQIEGQGGGNPKQAMQAQLQAGQNPEAAARWQAGQIANGGGSMGNPAWGPPPTPQNAIESQFFAGGNPGFNEGGAPGGSIDSIMQMLGGGGGYDNLFAGGGYGGGYGGPMFGGGFQSPAWMGGGFGNSMMSDPRLMDPNLRSLLSMYGGY